MGPLLLDNLRNLQTLIREQGLGATVVALPESKLSEAANDKSDTSTQGVLFPQLVVEEEIRSVCRDLFESGFLNQAVDEAFKAVEALVRNKSGLAGKSGEDLMRSAFSPDEPRLVWSDRSLKSEKDEQAGYYHLFSGGVIGIQGPVQREVGWISDEQTALEAILLAQHLLRKAKQTYPSPPPQKSVI